MTPQKSVLHRLVLIMDHTLGHALIGITPFIVSRASTLKEVNLLRIAPFLDIWAPFYYRGNGQPAHATNIIGSAEAVREREIQRETDGNDVTLVALKLAMNFALFLAKNVHLCSGEEFSNFPCQTFAPLSHLWNGADFTLSSAKNVTLLETARILRFASVKWRDRGPKHRNKRSNFRLHRPSSHRKKESN